MAENRFIITINRECGTGGRTIATQLGHLLGVKVYDKAILDNLTDKFNLTEEEIERLKAKKTHWWDDFVNFYRQFDVTPLEASDEKKHVTSMQIYNAEAKILLGLAKQESCIIVGRSGFHIFRDDPHAMKIFIIADEKHRVERYANKYGVSETEAQSIIHEIDNAREAFTKTFAGTSRYDARNYDLVCNVTGLNTEHVTSFLAEIIRRRFQTEKQESSQERAYHALDVKMKHRIMVIDDTPEMKDIFRFVFQDDEDIEIITSSSDHDELKRKLRYDIYIICFHHDGLRTDIAKLVAFVKRNLDRVQPLMLAISSDLVGVARMGIDGLGMMRKPFNPDKLSTQMHNTLSILAANRSINDVTHLPGNFVIDMTLKKKIAAQDKFVLIYIDIDKFKPFTDYYGILRASQIIRFLADVLNDAVMKHGRPGDFVGHVGGDDYVLILNDFGYAQTIGQEVIKRFEQGREQFYNPEDYRRGYIEIINRKGYVERFAHVTISLAMVSNEHTQYTTTAQVYKRMSEVKDDAKQISGSVMLCDTSQE